MSHRRSVDTAAEDARELELKYAVSDVDAVRQLVGGDSLAGLTAGPWRTVRVSDQYLDTAAEALRRRGYGARLRHADGRTLLTVKTEVGGASGRRRRERGLHDRMELEGRATRRLNPSKWPDSAARSVVQAALGDERLRTLFYLDQRREERDLTRDGDAVATLSLDTVDVRRFGRRVGTFAILEVESRETGNGARTLAAVAAALDEARSLQPEPRSKEEIARQLVDRARGERRAARPPRQPGVSADDRLSEAGRKVLRMHLLRMLAIELAARTGEDIEAVHKMRVATRRMRAAWRVFDGAFRPRLQRRFVDELRTIASALGAVRDIDVQLERLATYSLGLAQADADALTPLAHDWQRRRDEAHAALIGLLDSGKYDRFVADYRSFVDNPGLGAIQGRGERVRDVAAGRIWRAYERVRMHDTTVPWADVRALHSLRIDGKRLRYALEFFREALPGSVDRLIADVTRLQDHVGELNDANIGAETTREWLLSTTADLSDEQRRAAGKYIDASGREVARLRRGFGPPWRHLVGRSFRRRLALTIGSI